MRRKLRGSTSRFSVLLFSMFLLTSLPVFAGDTVNDTRQDNGQYAIGLWGDLPYTSAPDKTQETIGVPNMIADMNSQKLAFTVHDGDLKAGNFRPCNDALYVEALAFLNQLDAPAAFTPGDNDWTDCDRPNNGSFNSRERLTHERQVFFSTPYTAGQHQLLQEVQSDPLCLGSSGPEACVENRRWLYRGVMYATLNVPGSCNNLCDTAPDPDEFAARNA